MSTIIVCTDGSELANGAAVAGLAILSPADSIIVATAVDGTDPSLTMDGSGHAGPSMSPREFDAMRSRLLSEGRDAVEAAAAALGDSVQTRVIEGSPGPAICALADETSAAAIVMGSRGRGGLKRAFLGSVSDHVARNANCPVVIVRGGD